MTSSAVGNLQPFLHFFFAELEKTCCFALECFFVLPLNLKAFVVDFARETVLFLRRYVLLYGLFCVNLYHIICNNCRHVRINHTAPIFDRCLLSSESRTSLTAPAVAPNVPEPPRSKPVPTCAGGKGNVWSDLSEEKTYSSSRKVMERRKEVFFFKSPGPRLCGCDRRGVELMRQIFMHRFQNQLRLATQRMMKWCISDPKTSRWKFELGLMYPKCIRNENTIKISVWIYTFSTYHCHRDDNISGNSSFNRFLPKSEINLHTPHAPHLPNKTAGAMTKKPISICAPEVFASLHRCRDEPSFLGSQKESHEGHLWPIVPP